MFETITALATPPMKAALAIIRVSGDDAFSIVQKIFSRDIENVDKREIFYGNIIDENRIVDEVIINVYKGPNTFTGEDLCEIICHGSMLIADEIISLLIRNGARLALRGEFSSRAYYHGRIDLIQAEAINDVINATNKDAKNLSLLSLKGKATLLIEPLKNLLADLLSNIEVNIDYPEYQDIEEVNMTRVIKDVDYLNEQINKLIDQGQQGKIIKEGYKVAIVGKPNVGKSSILNAFLKENKAIVTDIAGTTRDIVEGEVNIGGIVLHLFDTAGIRESDDAIENIGIDKARQVMEEADLVLLVKESGLIEDEEDKELDELTKHKNRIVVYNKGDKGTSSGIVISAINDEIEPLVKAIKDKIGLEEESYVRPSLCNARQLGLLEKIKEALSKAKEDANKGMPIDLVSVNLLNAYNAMKEIVGENNYNDLSQEIFSRFCVGK